MGNILFSIDNYWDLTTIVGSSTNPSFPTSFIQNELRSVAWQSASVASVVTLDNDLLTAKNENLVLALFNYNFRDSVDLKFQADNTSDYSSLTTDQALTFHEKSIVEFFSSIDRYTRLRINDTGQPEGFHELGKLWLGPSIELEYNYEWELLEEFFDTTVKTRNPKTGYEFTDEGILYRRFPLNFITEKADRDTVMEIFEQVKTARPFVCLLENEDPITEEVNRLALYCKFDDPVKYTHHGPNAFSFPLILVEEAM